MSVYMFRAYLGPNPSKMTLQQAKDAWQKWVSNHTVWADDIISHSLTEVTNRAGVTYWLGQCRFSQEDSKSNLFQKLEDKYQNKVDWYRIGYHNCDHDEENGVGCSWDDEREWTAGGESIPPSIADFVNDQ